MKQGVLLDTSFFIRLLNDEDKLHINAKDYFRYFLESNIVLKISTVSIAEYCVKGKINELPLKNLQIIPFNLNHAKKTGEFANVIFEERKTTNERIHIRNIIPNDSKLFSQADLDQEIKYFVTSDTESNKTIALLRKKVKPNFDFIDISTPYRESFGILF